MEPAFMCVCVCMLVAAAFTMTALWYNCLAIAWHSLACSLQTVFSCGNTVLLTLLQVGNKPKRILPCQTWSFTRLSLVRETVGSGLTNDVDLF
ncbi:hypothetical protein BJ166DRAFT_525929 [Pestalotiopsis sp. NC0098]|nr:hypothetical protein BJ166DRAFT_525929 [Pestalotiopsis sp. NC0098]